MTSIIPSYPHAADIASLQTLIDSTHSSLKKPLLLKTVPYYEDESIVFEVDWNGHEVIRVKQGLRLREALETEEKLKAELTALRFKNQELQVKLAAISEASLKAEAESSKDKEALSGKQVSLRNLKNRFTALMQHVKPAELYSAFLKEEEQEAIYPPNQEVAYRIIEIPIQREIIVEVPVEREVEVIREVGVVREVEVPVYIEREVEVAADPAVVYVERIKEVPVEVTRYVEVIKEVPVEVEKIIEIAVEVEKIVEVERIVEREVEVPVEVEKIVYVDREVEVPIQRIVQQIVYRDRLVEVTVEREVLVEVQVPVQVVKEIIVEKEVIVEKYIPVEVQIERVVEVPVEKIVEVVRVVERIVEIPVQKVVEVEVIKQVPSESHLYQLAALQAQVEVLSNHTSAQSQQIETLKGILQTELSLNNDNSAIISRLNQKILQIAGNSPANAGVTSNGAQHSPTKDTDDHATSPQNGRSLSRITILSTHPRKPLPQAFRMDLNQIPDPILAQRLASAFHEISDKSDVQTRTNSRLNELLSSPEGSSGKEASLIQQAEAERLVLLGEVSSLRRENHQLKVELQSQEQNSQTEHLIEHLTQQLQQERTSHNEIESVNIQLREALAKAERELLLRNKQASSTTRIPLKQ